VPGFYGRTLSRTVPACHAKNGQNLGVHQNLGIRLKFTDFSQTIAVCVLGYSDFHNLMGFTSKKMPNNIL
jgi:hypothetical protein